MLETLRLLLNGIYVACEGRCSNSEFKNTHSVVFMKGSLVVFRHLVQVDFIIFMVLLQIVLGIYMELVFISIQLKNLILMELI